MLTEIYNEDTRFILAEDGGEPMGFAVLRLSGGEAELFRVVTRPSVRRRGIGSELLASLVEDARDEGIRRVFLEVRESNAAARALYEKHGFTAAGMRRGYYTEPVENAIVMVLEVENAGRTE